MGSHVQFQMAFKILITNRTCKAFNSLVYFLYMFLEVFVAGKPFIAGVTAIFPLTCVYKGVHFQVGRAGERSRAEGTFKRAFTCVCTEMIDKLTTTDESLTLSTIVTPVGFLTYQK